MKEISSPLIVVSHTVYTILPCGLRAVINIPNIASPLPVVDHYGVRARVIPPFPTFPHRIFAPRTPTRRLRALVNLCVEVSGEGGACAGREHQARRGVRGLTFPWQ